MKPNSINEALNFFNLSENYTLNELKKIYYHMIKNNHPDNHYGLGYEEKTKIINYYYGILLREKRKKNNLYQEIFDENSKTQEEYLLKQREKLEFERNNFKSILEKQKKIYSSIDEIVLICDKYLTLLLLTNDLQELNDYRKNYFEEVEKKINNLRQMKDFNFKVRKNAFANAYSYYLHQFINKNELEDAIRATKIYLTILNLIEKCKSDIELEELLKKIQLVKFKDLDNDENCLNEIKTNYPIFINKNNGVKVFLIDKNSNTVTYSRNLDEKAATVPFEQFNHTFISLENFIKNSYYVGNKRVEIHDKNGYVREDLLFQRYLYYDPQTKLMLLYSDDIDIDKFSFTNISFSLFDNFKRNNVNQKYFKIVPNSSREDIENGIYKDKEFLYQSIIDYFKGKKQIFKKSLPELLEEKSNITK